MLKTAYSVEKLDSFVNSIDFGKLSECNSLFLLRHVSAETSESRGKGVFQQNRPEAAVHGTGADRTADREMRVKCGDGKTDLCALGREATFSAAHTVGIGRYPRAIPELDRAIQIEQVNRPRRLLSFTFSP